MQSCVLKFLVQLFVAAVQRMQLSMMLLDVTASCRPVPAPGASALLCLACSAAVWCLLDAALCRDAELRAEAGEVRACSPPVSSAVGDFLRSRRAEADLTGAPQ